jgi:hypothetical protein
MPQSWNQPADGTSYGIHLTGQILAVNTQAHGKARCGALAGTPSGKEPTLSRIDRDRAYESLKDDVRAMRRFPRSRFARLGLGCRKRRFTSPSAPVATKVVEYPSGRIERQVGAEFRAGRIISSWFAQVGKECIHRGVMEDRRVQVPELPSEIRLDCRQKVDCQRLGSVVAASHDTQVKLDPANRLGVVAEVQAGGLGTPVGGGGHGLSSSQVGEEPTKP